MSTPVPTEAPVSMLPATQIPRNPEVVRLGMDTVQGFEAMQRAARMLAASTLLPEAYRVSVANKRNKEEMIPNPAAISNCIIAMNMANRLGADPLMVMQNLYIVEGKPAWSSQFIISAINSSRKFSPLRFELSKPGEEEEVEYTFTKWVDRQPKELTGRLKIRHQTCRAWAVELATGQRLEGPEISMRMAVEEGWIQKNGSKWRTMPEVMLRYRAASFFGKFYAPELLMGLQAAEELGEIIEAEAILPAAEPTLPAAPSPAPLPAPVSRSRGEALMERLQTSQPTLLDEDEVPL